MAIGLTGGLVRLGRHGAVVGVLVAAASCGGGGGGTPPPSLQITNVTPSRVDLNLNVGEQPFVRLTGTITGDLTQLNGRMIFVIVEDGNGAFVPATTSVVVAGATGEVSLAGPATTTAGSSSGTLRVFVCLDRQCNDQLGHSPVSVPYQISVHPTLDVPPVVTVTAPFGVEPAPVEVPISLPFGVADIRLTPDPAAPWLKVEVIRGLAPVLRVSALAQPVGQQIHQLRIDTTSQSSAGLRLQSQAFAIDHRVTASSRPVALAPTTLAMTYRRSQAPNISSNYAQAFVQPGFGLLTGARVVLDDPTVPQGGDPRAPYGSWLLFSASGRAADASACNTDSPPVCMLPGTYTARVIFSLDNGGLLSDHTIPVTLTVTP